ncbi:uncharacterized protein LOC117802655 [Ailuropoda melanoleuca]|uniref:uncharacterized protein LOC117802655 n=1 Tax=Ailuropoda melanoleuca TaxID=9646 RepID=UPI001494757A|nr:uncharacterized protein LOC117802655 [Ailuropoda melanoleuca]
MPAASASTTFWSHTGQRSLSGSPGALPPAAGSRCASRHGRQKACRQGRTCRRRAAAPGPPPPPPDDVDVCEDDDDADELEESGAGEPHISLHNRQIWKSVSGNEAICKPTRRREETREEEEEDRRKRPRWVGEPPTHSEKCIDRACDPEAGCRATRPPWPRRARPARCQPRRCGHQMPLSRGDTDCSRRTRRLRAFRSRSAGTSPDTRGASGGREVRGFPEAAGA